jgi:hypothetical protein
LLELTRRILTQGSEPDYPQLAQWILQRGHLIEQMAVFPVDKLSPHVKPQVLELLMAAQALDEAVMQNLEKCYAHLGEQLKGAKDAQALIDKYRVGRSAPPGTRSREA